MGLDMYLTKRTYIGAEYDHNNVTGTIQINKDGKEVPIRFDRIKYIEESVGYWRKANQIHNWFVENVQNGIDECQESDVTKEHLLKLLSICLSVKNKEDAPEKLLPIKKGFFFGGNEYDEWYFNQIDDTIEFIQSILNESDPKKDYLSFGLTYRASW